MKKYLALFSLFVASASLAQFPGSMVTPCCVAISSGGTGVGTASGAFNALAPIPTRSGDVLYWNGTAWVTLPGNNSGTQVLQENPSGVPSWVTPSAGTVTSVTNSDGTITVTGTSAAPVVSRAAITGDTSIPATSNISTTTAVNGVSYPASPSINTIPYVSGTNTVSYDATTGSLGAIVLSVSPTLTTPTIGVASASSVAFTGATAPTNGIYLPATNRLGFATAGTTGWSIDGSQRLLSGTYTSQGFGGVAGPALQVLGLTQPAGSASFGVFNATQAAATLNFLSSTGSTVGSHGAVAAGPLGVLTWAGDDGTSYTNSARIMINATGTVSADIVPGQFAFQTANSSGTLTTALTLTSAQQAVFGSGITVNGLTGYVQCNGSSACTASSTIPTTSLTGTLQAAQFPALTGAISTTAGSLTTSFSSDPTAYSFIGNFTSGAAAPGYTTFASTLGNALRFDTAENKIDFGLINGSTVGAPLTGTSHTFACADSGKYFYRSNSGTAMTDTLPTCQAGFNINIRNNDASATDTITSTGNTFGAGSDSSYTINYGRRTWFGFDGTSNFGNIANDSNLYETSGTAPTSTHIAVFGTRPTIDLADSTYSFPLSNSALANTATTVNGQTCTLGSTCTVTAAPSGTAGGALAGSYPNPTLASTITAGGPTGGANTVPVITYNAAGQLTVVSTATVTPSAIGAPSGSGTSTGSNSGDVTLTTVGPTANANGASLSGQQLQLQPASASFAGLLAAADYAFLQAFENKTVLLATSNQYASIKCDGATDDSAAWNTLLTNAPTNSLIVIPSCTTMLTSATNPSIPSGKHFTIQGAGQSKTVIQSNNNSADFFTVNDWYNNFVGMTFQGLNTTVTSSVALSSTPISLAVGSTTNFPASGSFYVQTNLGWTLAAYTSVTNSTTLAGVTAASSTTVAGGPITIKTGGYAINSGSNAHALVKDVQFNYVYNGWLNNGTLGFLLDSTCFGTVNYSAQFNGANVNAVVHNFSCDGAPPAVAHLEVEQSGSLLVSDCDLIRAQTDMRLNPTSPNGVFGVYVVNTYFDTATAVSGTANSGNGVLLQGTGNIQRLKILNSWMSSASHDGFWANSTATTLPTDIELTGNNIYSNGANGVDWTAAQDFIIHGNQIAGNTTDGVSLTAAASSVTRGILYGNRIGPSGGIGANGTGLAIAAGTYGNLKVYGNDISGNTTANINDAVTSVTNTLAHDIHNNVGMPIAPNLCTPAQLYSATTITKVNCNSVFFPQNSVRIGTTVRETIEVTCAATANATPGFVPALRFGSADTSSDTAIIATPAYVSPGTAALGAAEFIWDFTILSSTTAHVSLTVKNLNNAATGVNGAVTIYGASGTTPITIPNITTQNNFLGTYFTSTTASVDTIRSVKYEVIQ